MRSAFTSAITFAACLLLATLAWPQANSGGLERVLAQMDTAAKNFRSAEASFVWEQYQKVINETDMAADISEPDKKYILYSGGKVQVYQPKIDQVTEYNPGKNRSDLESFLVLGFGGSGHELLKSYDVKHLGSETIDGIDVAKLELTPKSAKLRNNIAKILLWIDPARGVSVQQQFVEPGGDYRLAKYSDIHLNQKLPDSVFKLKTTGKTKIVSPQG